jgi:hypothetical protein
LKREMRLRYGELVADAADEGELQMRGGRRSISSA